jgi:hypothetical protein
MIIPILLPPSQLLYIMTFAVFFAMTFAVLLSDHNIPQLVLNEKLIDMILDIIFFNV